MPVEFAIAADAASPAPRNGKCYAQQSLLAWMDYMEDYGAAWLKDTGTVFYSQEYWYLVTMTLVRHWQGRSLNVSDAYRTMKTGSSRTRENRLNTVIAEHWGVKVKHDTDLRRTCLEPTDELLQLGREHFRSSLGKAVRLLSSQRLLAHDPAPLLHRIDCATPNLDAFCLLPWAEFLIAYTDDWNVAFQKRFRTNEYWLLFVRCLRGGWADRPLTMGEACECMATGSGRTREKRIAFAVSRGLLEKRRDGHDHRMTSVLPTRQLEACLRGHFARTLNDAATLMDRLSAAT